MTLICSSSLRSAGPRRRPRVPCLAGSLLALAAAVAWARPVPDAAEAPPFEHAPTARVAQQGPVSLEQATAMAVRQFGGRVVRAETTTQGGRMQHVIRLLDQDGRVITVRIDAQTGRFL